MEIARVHDILSIRDEEGQIHGEAGPSASSEIHVDTRAHELAP